MRRVTRQNPRVTIRDFADLIGYNDNGDGTATVTLADEVVGTFGGPDTPVWSGLVGRPSHLATGVEGDGSTDDQAALASSDDTALAASLPLMLPPGTYKVSSNLTIDSPVWFLPGAVLKPDDGITVTLAGGVVNAPPSQIFDTSAGGVVVLANTPTAHPQWWGAVGDADTDDTDAFVSLFAGAVTAHLRQDHKLDNVSVTARAMSGELWNRLVAGDEPDPETGLSNPILQLRGGSSLRNVTIDGEEALSLRVAVGGEGDENILVENVKLVDCASNSFRVSDDTSGVRLLNIYADNSKVFNTQDESDPTNLLFSGIVCVNSPNEAFLIDLPGSNTDWTGFVLSNSIWEASENSKRAISVARAVGGVITGQVMRGALNTDPYNSEDTDMIHFEDRAAVVSVVGNVMETNGSTRAIDVSHGGDELYEQEDRLTRELLLTANLYKASDSETDYLVWMEGTSDKYYDKISIHGESMLCNGVAVPIRALLSSGVVGPNSVYEATGPEYVRDGTGVANSDFGANIIRRTTNHVHPKFLRGDLGHGYNPENVLFRTTFGHDSYTNFQAWAEAIETQTGATVAAFGGSLGSGTITFVEDGTTGAYFLRATRGSSAMTARMDLTWTARDADFQNLDALCARILTRSSIQSAGKIELVMPNTGVAMYTKVLNDGSDFADWKADGASKFATSAADFSGTTCAIQVRVYFGHGLTTENDTCDWGILAVSVNRSTPF